MSRVHASPILPTELWFQIIQQLPFHDQRSCMSISKLLHDVSQPFVFSHIIVRFGLWRRAELNEDWTDEQKAEADYATRLSLELLQYIIHLPELARSVTRITVRAYTPAGDSHSAELMDVLVAALKLLRLRAFAWDGCRPEPRTNAIHALCETSGASLSEVLLPPNIPETLSPWLPLIDQFQLQSLSFQSRHAYPLPHDYDVDRFAHMAKTVAANTASLRYLCLDGSELVEACSMVPCATLVELDLLRLDPINISGMRAVFQHCPQLRALALSLNDDGHTDGEVEGLLHDHRDALPHLTAFKFLGYFTGDEEVKALARFLKRKTALERLDFVNPGGESYGFDGGGLDSAPLLKILKHLPRVAVLGCDIRISKLTKKHLARLARWLPQSVAALSLTVAARECAAAERDWAQFFEGRSACRYLHIILDPETKHGDLTLDLREVAARHPPASLELLGYEDTLRWVSPGRDAGPATDVSVDKNENVRSGVWPPARVHFRTVGDFGGHEEWEWLLRYRDLPLRCYRCSGAAVRGEDLVELDEEEDSDDEEDSDEEDSDGE